jgi:cytochrome c554/c'-like protein
MRCKFCCLGFLTFLLMFNVASSSAGPAESAAPQKPGMYHGPGSCAASSCHGNVQPQKLTRVMQNEYSTWIGQDKHANAYTVLTNDVSVRMGKILQTKCADGSPCPPSQAPKCLACHSLHVAPELHVQAFGPEDGVSCESCHGPSSGWLETHTHKDSHTDSVTYKQMNDLRDLRERTTVCLTCHIGTANKFVDHEMIAAGHPDLMFEITYFSFRMPQHWRDPEQDPWRSVQAWGVGQAVQLRDSLYRLARRAGDHNTPWPEYSELDCYACHHSLSAASDSWRLKAADYYGNRRPGNPPWNEARVIVFRDVIEELHPETAKQLNKELWDVADQMNKLNGNRQDIAATATRAAELANSLADKLNTQPYDSALTLRLMRRIAANYSTIANAGYGSAAQAAMTLDDLSKAYQQNGGQEMNSGLSASIDALNKLLNEENPSAYSAAQFADRLQNVSKALGVRQGSASGSN